MIKNKSAFFLKKELSTRFFLLLWKASLIILSNIFTWLPIVIFSFMASIKKSFLTQKTYNWIFIIFLPLNPILNVFIHSNFNFKISRLKRIKKLYKFKKNFFFPVFNYSINISLYNFLAKK